MSPVGGLHDSVNHKTLDGDDIHQYLVRQLDPLEGAVKRRPWEFDQLALAVGVVPTEMSATGLNEASLQTTDTYLSHIAPKQVLEVITARSWDAP
jgi:hypothetical protein